MVAWLIRWTRYLEHNDGNGHARDICEKGSEVLNYSQTPLSGPLNLEKIEGLSFPRDKANCP